MAELRKIVIVGATSVIAEHCARLWAKQAPTEFILVGRNREKLEVVATDLSVRATDCSVSCKVINFFDVEQIELFAGEVNEERSVDTVLIAHGSAPEQAVCEGNLLNVKEKLEVNALSPVLFAEAFIKRMEEAGKGTLALIGSVAGDRGRKKNYIYGAAKSLVARYAEGLQHRFAGTSVDVAMIKPGPTDTPMAADLKETGFPLASAESVAGIIVKALAKKKEVVYCPSKWAAIMFIIRHLPKFIFNRMNI